MELAVRDGRTESRLDIDFVREMKIAVVNGYSMGL
jgi:hypothetical protein